MKLTNEEKELLKEIENEEFISSKEEISKYVNMAKNFNKKNKTITLRISENDLYKLKLKALESGIPYQNLIQSLIHKYVEGNLKIEL
jgi:predicted DNA binding CopG/RHH family protein